MVGNGHDDNYSERQRGFVFPCSFSLKVLGKNTNEFYYVVVSIVEKHVRPGAEITYSSRTSNKNKYLAVTATFQMESREQLEAVYKELSESPLVLMTL